MPEPERGSIPSAASAGGSIPADADSSESTLLGPQLLPPPPKLRWYQKLAGIAAAIFCFELGVFLLLFPWAKTWDVGYGAFLPIWARAVWVDPYFRGAISGVGLLNMYIGLSEIHRLRH